MTYVLPESLNWLGWAAMGAIIAGFALLWRWYRRRKAATRLEPDPPVCRLPGFPSVHATVDVLQGEVDTWAGRMRSIYTLAWTIFISVYSTKDARPMPIEKVYLTLEPVDDDHRPILWRAPHPLVTVQIQKALPYWWAAELHNIFRYANFGMDHIYNERNPDDLMRMNLAAEWIDRSYRHDEQ